MPPLCASRASYYTIALTSITVVIIALITSPYILLNGKGLLCLFATLPFAMLARYRFRIIIIRKAARKISIIVTLTRQEMTMSGRSSGKFLLC